MTSGRRLEALMDAMHETTLTATQRYVVLCLSKYADHRTGRNARPTVRTLADDAAVHTDTVLAALANAESAGLITATAKAHRRPTVWAVLPEPGVRTTRTAVSDSGEQSCSEPVRHLSDSPESTTKTTAVTESSPREEMSVSPHTPTTNGAGGSVQTDPLQDLPPAARTFVADLAALALVKTPTHHELCDLADLAEFGQARGYGHITARAFFEHARDKRITGMVKHAPTIFSEAARHSPPRMEVPF